MASLGTRRIFTACAAALAIVSCTAPVSTEPDHDTVVASLRSELRASARIRTLVADLAARGCGVSVDTLDQLPIGTVVQDGWELGSIVERIECSDDFVGSLDILIGQPVGTTGRAQIGAAAVLRPVPVLTADGSLAPPGDRLLVVVDSDGVLQQLTPTDAQWQELEQAVNARLTAASSAALTSTDIGARRDALDWRDLRVDRTACALALADTSVMRGDCCDCVSNADHCANIVDMSVGYTRSCLQTLACAGGSFWAGGSSVTVYQSIFNVGADRLPAIACTGSSSCPSPPPEIAPFCATVEHSNEGASYCTGLVQAGGVDPAVANQYQNVEAQLYQAGNRIENLIGFTATFAAEGAEAPVAAVGIVLWLVDGALAANARSYSNLDILEGYRSSTGRYSWFGAGPGTQYYCSTVMHNVYPTCHRPYCTSGTRNPCIPGLLSCAGASTCTTPVDATDPRLLGLQVEFPPLSGSCCSADLRAQYIDPPFDGTYPRAVHSGVNGLFCKFWGPDQGYPTTTSQPSDITRCTFAPSEMIVAGDSVLSMMCPQ